jgi:TRAP-type mannitol/chloroaromatic compound transport system permease small subunit
MEIDPNEEAEDEPEAERGFLARWFAILAYLLAAIGTIWILVLMLVIVADVVGRNFLDAPITGVAEVAGRSVVAIVFLQLTSAVIAGRMTRADFLTRIIAARAPSLMRIMNVLFSLAGALVFAAIVYATWPDLMTAWRRNEFFGVPGVWTVPTYPFRAVIIVGATGAALAYLGIAIGHLLRPPREVRP